MAKGLRSKARKKCNTEKRLKLKKFEAQRLERIVAKMDEVRKHTMEISVAPPLPVPQASNAVLVRVTTLLDEGDESTKKPLAGRVTKKRVVKQKQ